MCRWEIMDSAPMDGTTVLVAVETDGDVDIVPASIQPEPHFLHKRPYWGTGDIRHWLDLYACEPVAWRPLAPDETIV